MFFCIVSMVIALWQVIAILENVRGIQRQNYVAWLQRSEIPVVFHYRNLILGIYCFRLTILNVRQWSNG